MNDASAIALSAQLAVLHQTDVIANNLANLGTAGYRSQQATFRSLLTGSGAVAWNPLNAAVNDFGVRPCVMTN